MNWKDKEAVNKYFREYQKANREKRLLALKKYREKNRELLKFKAKSWRIKNILKEHNEQ